MCPKQQHFNLPVEVLITCRINNNLSAAAGCLASEAVLVAVSQPPLHVTVLVQIVSLTLLSPFVTIVTLSVHARQQLCVIDQISMKYDKL